MRRREGRTLRPLLVHDRARTIDGATESDGLRPDRSGAPFGDHEAFHDLAEERALVDLRVSVEEFVLFRSDGNVLPLHPVDRGLGLCARGHTGPTPGGVYVCMGARVRSAIRVSRSDLPLPTRPADRPDRLPPPRGPRPGSTPGGPMAR